MLGAHLSKKLCKKRCLSILCKWCSIWQFNSQENVSESDTMNYDLEVSFTPWTQNRDKESMRYNEEDRAGNFETLTPCYCTYNRTKWSMWTTSICVYLKTVLVHVFKNKTIICSDRSDCACCEVTVIFQTLHFLFWISQLTNIQGIYLQWP